MKWRIVRRDRSKVRVELFEEGIPRNTAYINIEGSKAKGYRWYSSTEILGHGVFDGKFKDVSQDAAIETAIKQWKMRLQEIVDLFTDADIPEPVEVKGKVG